MPDTSHCLACGATLTGGQTCQDHFHLMAGWELDNALFDVHHLMVLCYHLQHPHLYSPAGLRGALRLLVDFVEHGLTPQQVRQRDAAALDSGRRRDKITGTPDAHGTYPHPVRWTMTAPDVTAGGVDRYQEQVRAWARAVYTALQASGNLPNE